MSRSVKAAIFVSILLNVLILASFFSGWLRNGSRSSTVELDEGVRLHFVNAERTRLERVEGVYFWHFRVETPKIAQEEAYFLHLVVQDGVKKTELGTWMFDAKSPEAAVTLAIKPINLKPAKIKRSSSFGGWSSDTFSIYAIDKNEQGTGEQALPDIDNIFQGLGCHLDYAPCKVTIRGNKRDCDLITGVPHSTEKEIIEPQKRLYLVVTKGKSF